MSDERDRAGSAGTDDSDDGSSSAVVTRPVRPSGKRTRRATGEDVSSAVDLETGTEAAPTKNGSGTAKKTAKKRGEGPEKGQRNPITFVWNYLKQVVAELRKVIWPNRKQMVSYTMVVLVFLAFMVALIGGVDLGVGKLVMWVFG